MDGKEIGMFILSLIITCLILMVGFLSGLKQGSQLQQKLDQELAIKMGVAKYVVDNKGKVTFQWITKKEK